jgi:hypothetical protein
MLLGVSRYRFRPTLCGVFGGKEIIRVLKTVSGQ